MEQFSSLQEELMPYFVEYGLELIGAIAILIVGLVAAKWLGQRIERYMDKSERFDPTITPLFVKATKILIIAVTILAVLNKFGVETASLIAVLGTIGLAIGLALQGTLSNIASGIMLFMLRPFNVGDAVDIGSTSGVVDEIGLFVTEMHTFDNIAITMPNSKVWGTEIRNYSRNDKRRVDMEFGIAYDDDMDKAMNIVNEVLAADDRVLDEPEPLVAVSNLGDSAVGIRVRPWTETPNAWPLRYALTKRIKERFDEEDISFPFPQRDVHLFQDNG
ncbi:mechanosensitive ion channel family protein [Fodinibius sp. AD559]|uniref:mechanosensitive ion channel family protein n=1 Tax=Fodinibius sp. AD559 TaxID=3424179 RepID=UPI004046BD6B